MCLNIIDNEGEERILYRAILVIESLLKNKEIGDYFITCGGIQVIFYNIYVKNCCFSKFIYYILLIINIYFLI